MSLYRVTPDKLEPVSRTTFATEKLLERKDLQRLLRRDITPIGEDLMVIAEEYGDWEDLPGGWKSPEADWPDMQDRMIEVLIRLENALRKPVQELNV